MERNAQVVDQSRVVELTFDGRRYTGYEGDTIASALYRAGVRVFSRSFKYHRPRGLLCLNGSCPNCLVNVDGMPNVRACSTPLKAGMTVRSQNAWPSLKHDVLAINDRLDRFLPVGFHPCFTPRSSRRWASAFVLVVPFAFTPPGVETRCLPLLVLRILTGIFRFFFRRS